VSGFERDDADRNDRRAGDRDGRPTGLRRREFLKQGTVTALGVGALGTLGREAFAADTPRVRSYRTLGKTGLRMPDISFGTGSTVDPQLVRYAFERGVTYFDTAEGYPLKKPGLAEKVLGEALQGKRDQVVLTSKQVTQADEKRGSMMRKLNQSLRRLQTDHIDVYFNHAVNDVAVMANPEWAEFVALAKKQGKIRFSGMSGHGGNLQECLGYALDHQLVDVILTAYNFGQDPAFYERFTKSFDIVANQQGLPRVLKRAHEAGVGVVVMKTLMGARLNDMRPWEKPNGTFAQAAFRWTLSNPDVDGLIVSMKTTAEIDEYLGASGMGAPRAAELRLLEGYAARNSATQCRQGCGDCANACPFGVPISDVLRSRMYANDYGEPENARALYASLETDASACASCTSRACADACGYGLDVPALTGSTPGILGVG
jgi:predicted aldo/keto reductase-like oxidoreductase